MRVLSQQMLLSIFIFITCGACSKATPEPPVADLERLHCLETLSPAQSCSAAVQDPNRDGVTTLSGDIGWVLVRFKSKVVPDKISHVLVLSAVETNHPGLPPILGVRCKNEKLAAVLNFHEILGRQNAVVRLQFDSELQREATWDLTKRDDAAILRQPNDFLETLNKSSVLIAEVTTLANESYHAVFNLQGFQQGFAAFPEQCQKAVRMHRR